MKGEVKMGIWLLVVGVLVVGVAVLLIVAYLLDWASRRPSSRQEFERIFGFVPGDPSKLTTDQALKVQTALRGFSSRREGLREGIKNLFQKVQSIEWNRFNSYKLREFAESLAWHESQIEELEGKEHRAYDLLEDFVYTLDSIALVLNPRAFVHRR